MPTFSVDRPVSFALLAGASLAALAADQASKAGATRRAGASRPWLPLLRGRANTRAPIARLSRRRLLADWLVVAMLACGGWVALEARDSASVAGAVSLGLLLGGTAGNAIDAWRYAAIIDMLDVGWWPVFNVADAAVVVGAVGLVGVVVGGW